mgnify:CR=1 FL=1
MYRNYSDSVHRLGTPVADVCDFYGLPAPAHGELPVASWIASTLGRTPIVGDEVQLGPATLVIRSMKGDTIRLVGLKLPPESH